MGLENYFSYCSKRMIFFSPLPSLSKERERHNTSHNYPPVAIQQRGGERLCVRDGSQLLIRHFPFQ
jgi:hypothetical protein